MLYISSAIAENDTEFLILGFIFISEELSLNKIYLK